MAKFDVYRSDQGSVVLDCQSDLLSGLNTRFVVPLADPDDAVQVDRKLNPILDVAGDPMMMLTHFASAIPASAIGYRIASTADQQYVVANALDMLISGY